jgi:hypothetical protein
MPRTAKGRTSSGRIKRGYKLTKGGAVVKAKPKRKAKRKTARRRRSAKR